MLLRTHTRRAALLLATSAGLAAGPVAALAAPKTQTDAVVTLGRAGAPVTVVEYASVTCGHCADWDAQVWPAFKAKYVDTGKVRYELREMLTPPAQLSAAGWMLARCAGPAKSLSVVKAFYRAQGEMAQAGDVRAILVRIGREAGMTNAQVAACLNDQAALAALNKRVEAALARGVDRTPLFFINGRKHEGDITLAGLDAALQPLLARRR
jgi:protein-disulfide isomerase